MAHHTLKSGYASLADRLNRFPQGAPPSDLLFKILKMLFSEKEARLVASMPIKPFTARKASRIWKMDMTSTQGVLDELADYMENQEAMKQKVKGAMRYPIVIACLVTGMLILILVWPILLWE